MNPRYNFYNQVAFITGASSGMGLATARAFAEAGAAVALVDANADAAQMAADELTGNNHRALAIGCDVTDEVQVAAAVAATVDTFGGLHLAFNNAGIQAPWAESADEEFEDFERVNAVNYRGVWASMKHELRWMREHGGGAIVNCSSVGGLRGGPGRAAYHGSKHAVIGLTKSAARAYGRRGVRVNAICPGTIETPMVASMIDSAVLDPQTAIDASALGRLGRPEEIAAAVLWLASPAASFVTGTTLLADGGSLA